MSKKSKLTKPVQLWLKALRSGKYLQAQMKLKDSRMYNPETETCNLVGYCCLGVACEVAKQQGVIKDFRGRQGLLPVVVRDWLGLSTTSGEFESEGEFSGYDSLVYLNDEKELSFKQIANVIERQPKGLFKKETK